MERCKPLNSYHRSQKGSFLRSDPNGRYQRDFALEPLQTALVDFTLQTRGREHLDQILEVIKAAGRRASLPDADPMLPQNGD